MTELLIFALLVVTMAGYMRLARHFDITDEPNHRSSHRRATIRGGGIVFVAGVVLYALFSGAWTWALAGVLLAAAISFLDDIRPLHQFPRLVGYLLATVGIFLSAGILDFSWVWWIVGVILVLGWINAFNFMDGINGITVLYAVVALGTFYLLPPLEDQRGLIEVLLLSCFVFGFLNVRKRARVFAGDVGSVSVAFLLAYFMTLLIVRTGEWAYIGFFSVYGVDSVLTIAHRLLRRENIFKAHRSHLYQFLANEMGWSHVVVSSLYAILQLGINVIVILAIRHGQVVWAAPLTLGILVAVYTWSKRQILARYAV